MGWEDQNHLYKVVAHLPKQRFCFDDDRLHSVTDPLIRADSKAGGKSSQSLDTTGMLQKRTCQLRTQVSQLPNWSKSTLHFQISTACHERSNNQRPRCLALPAASGRMRLERVA